MLLVVEQNYRTRVEAEDVTLGNSVFLECQIPSYASDLVSVVAWVDEETGCFKVNSTTDFAKTWGVYGQLWGGKYKGN